MRLPRLRMGWCSMKWPKPVRRKILDRAQGRCEGCGKPIPDDVDIHHRKYPSRGGESTVDNGLALCGRGNVLAFGCHGKAHSGEFGESRGWAVHSWDNPTQVPVWRFESWWLLTDDKPLPLTPDEAAELRALYRMEPESLGIGPQLLRAYGMEG